ncbi:MAG: 5-(carboxyamino)imidazole ribonucleotide mutase [Acidobacteria bacterium]|nr:5-(carboxyamino)imidazole ribonucleotide mutase [Acidobacteriota bacterium]
MSRVQVGILMGSKSDVEVMREAAEMLNQFGIVHEMRVLSAHRSPESVSEYARTAESRGIQVIIAGAGGAAHLAGVLASQTILPIIGVPLESSPLKGLDALLATVQMPAGVPVATVAIGKAGAKNAALLATRILGRSDAALADKLRAYKERLRQEVDKTAL